MTITHHDALWSQFKPQCHELVSLAFDEFFKINGIKTMDKVDHHLEFFFTVPRSPKQLTTNLVHLLIVEFSQQNRRLLVLVIVYSMKCSLKVVICFLTYSLYFIGFKCSFISSFGKNRLQLIQKHLLKSYPVKYLTKHFSCNVHEHLGQRYILVP